MADARQLVNKARKEAKDYKNFYDSPIPGKILCERLAGFMHLYTLYGHVRPFGCSVILAAKDKDGHHLFMIEPSGTSFVSTQKQLD
jgi:20S proteasome subunit alpha 7